MLLDVRQQHLNNCVASEDVRRLRPREHDAHSLPVASSGSGHLQQPRCRDDQPRRASACDGQRRATIAITLIGTGAGPTVDSTRAGPSTLVEAGDERLLFDAGREATTQLARAGIPFGAVKTVVLTHLHSDHIVGLSDLFLSPWGARGGSSRSRWP